MLYFVEHVLRLSHSELKTISIQYYQLIVINYYRVASLLFFLRQLTCEMFYEVWCGERMKDWIKGSIGCDPQHHDPGIDLSTNTECSHQPQHQVHYNCRHIHQQDQRNLSDEFYACLVICHTYSFC